MLALLCGVLLAAPTAAPVHLASPGWRFINIEEAKGEFFADYLAQQVQVQAGIPVTTGSEIAQLLGFERQKALLGCSDTSTSCLAELSGALGVDGLILGSLARFESVFVVNVKVIRASDGQPLAVFSQQVKTESQLVEWLAQIAPRLGAEVNQRLRGGPPPAPPAPQSRTLPGSAWWRAPPGLKPLAWIPAASGAVAAGAGAFLWWDASEKARHIAAGDGVSSYPQLVLTRSAGEAELLGARVLLPLSGLALLGAGWMFFAADQPKVSVVPANEGGAVVLSGVLP